MWEKFLFKDIPWQISISWKLVSIDWKFGKLKFLKKKKEQFYTETPQFYTQYFMNEMHEYEIKSFSKTHEFNPDLPRTIFSTFFTPKIKH